MAFLEDPPMGTATLAQPTVSISTLLPIPSESTDPNFGHLRIINDVLYPKGEAPYFGYDLQLRIALFVVTQATPIVSALFLIFSRVGWWRPKFYWTMSRLMALWLISVQIFGIIVYVQKGATTRVLFLAGALHLQIEYLIIALLLGASALQGLFWAWVGGTILYTAQLFIQDLSVVYLLTTIAGFSDFLIPILLVYGKQWLYAIGGFAHLIQAISVFCIVVKNYGHVAFDVFTFFTTWIMNGFLVAAVFQAWRQRRHTGPIHLHGADNLLQRADELIHSHHHHNGDEAHESRHESDSDTAWLSDDSAVDNPLAGINIPRPTLLILAAVSIGGSIISAFVFTFVVARK